MMIVPNPQGMLRHVEPGSIDERPLLWSLDEDDDFTAGVMQDFTGGSGGENVDDKGGGGSTTPYKRTRRPRRKVPTYRSGSHCIILRNDDLLVKVTEEEDEEEPGERKAVSVVVEYGACGLASCGHSPTWRTLTWVIRFIYSYYYFLWTAIFASLAICTTLSVVYEAWLTQNILGQAAVVMAMLPTLNLIWVVASFVWHILCWGVWTDFHDLEASLQGLRRTMQSQLLRRLTSLTVATAVNLPVTVSFCVFVYQLAVDVYDWVWRVQFWLSFSSAIVLAAMFFLGAIVGQDHTLSLPPPPPAPPRWMPRFLHGIWFAFQGMLSSRIFRAIRVYARSAFVDGGAFNEDPTVWGRYANEYLPQPVDLEDEQGMSTKYMKKWCTPWFAGWYLRHYLKEYCGCGAGWDKSPWFSVVVCGPWVLLLMAILALLGVLGYAVEAWALIAFVGGYFIVLPVFHWAAFRVLGHSSQGRLFLDVLLLLLLSCGFLLSILVASQYLGYLFLVVVVFANLANLLVHIPAIRDRDYPPPSDHRQGLAFNTKARCHRIIASSRIGAFSSVLLVLALALALRTVPTNNPSPFHPKNNPQKQPQNIRTHAHDTRPSNRYGYNPLTPLSAYDEPLKSIEYPFCRERLDGNLSVVDFGRMSQAAYMDIAEAQAHLDEHVTSGRYHVARVKINEEHALTYGPTVYHMVNEDAKVAVIAVRGTEAVYDVYQDLDVWCEAIAIQISSYLFPLYGSPMFQPIFDKFVGSQSHLVDMLSTLKNALLNRGTFADAAAMRYYYDQLTVHVREKFLTDPKWSGYRLMFTGHSLGGGVAQIVAARLKRKAVTFSAPGVVLSRRKFDVTIADCDAYLINIAPQGDLIPLIDVQAIKQQQVRCAFDRLSYFCHSLDGTLEEIISNCVPN